MLPANHLTERQLHLHTWFFVHRVKKTIDVCHFCFGETPFPGFSLFWDLVEPVLTNMTARIDKSAWDSSAHFSSTDSKQVHLKIFWCSVIRGLTRYYEFSKKVIFYWQFLPYFASMHFTLSRFSTVFESRDTKYPPGSYFSCFNRGKTLE